MTSALRNRLSLNAPKKNVRKNGKNLREKNMSVRIGVKGFMTDIIKNLAAVFQARKQ